MRPYLGPNLLDPVPVVPLLGRRRLVVPSGWEVEVVLMAFVPPLGSGRLRGADEGEPLAVEHIVRPDAGLERGEPLSVDTCSRGDLVDGHRDALSHRPKLLAGVGWLCRPGHMTTVCPAAPSREDSTGSPTTLQSFQADEVDRHWLPQSAQPPAEHLPTEPSPEPIEPVARSLVTTVARRRIMDALLIGYAVSRP